MTKEQAPNTPPRPKRRRISIQLKFIIFLTLSLSVFGLAAMLATYNTYLASSVEQHKRMALGAVQLVANCIDPDKVEEYLAYGEAAPGYLETKKRLEDLRQNYLDVKYVYVYKIAEDGCHVVFDIDTEESWGTPPGEVIPFDESFNFHVPALLAGSPIDPVITDDTYGWLLTVYDPVYDAAGKCVCYAAVDMAMEDIRLHAREQMQHLALVYVAILVIVLFTAYHFAKTQIISPINTMAKATEAIAYNSEEALSQGLKGIKALNIHTGDELENLYLTFVQMIEDGVRHLTDIKAKKDTIAKMQHALIVTLADMVEKRDQNTGEHIRKTSAYVEIIMNSMLKNGIYAEELTADFCNDVKSSAPLHDVGKINVPDAILNKPGRLTAEEFNIMKAHTTAGEEIISDIIDSVPAAEYLYVARNLATYHHERWDGTGYPEGLKGKDIPLSARIMAVADVFDALVSTRSYKKGFPYEKALAIIREESGTHFDPQIVEAFFAAQDEILQVAEKFKEQEAEGSTNPP
ncbi:MAG: HD domain-containing protein [Selenomonadaceae bacterium]|nr:HD domain-containing protein [Selenomonadaceae bacterium]